jgi:RNA polymerase sigma-70 factor (ECF subfamily)
MPSSSRIPRQRQDSSSTPDSQQGRALPAERVRRYPDSTDVLAHTTFCDVEAESAADGQLLAAAAMGDRHAFTVLYKRHSPWLAARLSRRCADASQVDEILQDTFVAVWRGATGWDGRGLVPAWIWGIAARRLVDAMRRRPRPTCSLSDLAEAAGPRAASAEDEALRDLEYCHLGRALAGLAPDLRLVVEATVLHGLSTREASRLLDIPAGTVKTRMMRARQVLRAHLRMAELELEAQGA